MTTDVLVLGLDPFTVPGVDSGLISEALDAAGRRFDGTGLEAETVLLPLAEGVEELSKEAISRREWDCVVIGGGIRKPEELMEFFETIVNQVITFAPGAKIAFNSNGLDSLEAAQRVLGS